MGAGCWDGSLLASGLEIAGFRGERNQCCGHGGVEVGGGLAAPRDKVGIALIHRSLQDGGKPLP